MFFAAFAEAGSEFGVAQGAMLSLTWAQVAFVPPASPLRVRHRHSTSSTASACRRRPRQRKIVERQHAVPRYSVRRASSRRPSLETAAAAYPVEGRTAADRPARVMPAERLWLEPRRLPDRQRGLPDTRR